MPLTLHKRWLLPTRKKSSCSDDDGEGCQTDMGRSGSLKSGSGMLEPGGQVMVGISTAGEAETGGLGQEGEGRPKNSTQFFSFFLFFLFWFLLLIFLSCTFCWDFFYWMVRLWNVSIIECFDYWMFRWFMEFGPFLLFFPSVFHSDLFQWILKMCKLFCGSRCKESKALRLAFFSQRLPEVFLYFVRGLHT